MVPSPITAAVCPAARPLRSTACIPTENGSTRQPCSKLTVGGRAYRVRAFTAMYWAMAPFLRYSVQATPTMRRCAQRLCIPWVQNQQWPQYSVESKVTRSPTAQLCTASPSCAMVPLASWPMTSGGMRRPFSPLLPCTSLPQMAQAFTSTSTSSGAGSGRGTSRYSKVCGAVNTSAFIMFTILPRSRPHASKPGSSSCAGFRPLPPPEPCSPLHQGRASGAG